IDGPRLARLLADQPGSEPDAAGERDVQVVYLQEGRTVRRDLCLAHAPVSEGAVPPTPAASSAPGTRRHAARLPSETRYSAGSTVGHGSNAFGQRGWNEHPVGRSDGNGGSPGSPEGALRNRESPISGKAAASASV